MSLNAIRQRLQRRREEMGATHEQLAAWSGLPVGQIDRIESSDEPFSVAEYEALCRGLAVHPATLRRGEERSPHRTIARFRSATFLEHPEALDVRTLAVAAEVSRVLGALHRKLRGAEPSLLTHRQVRAIDEGVECWRQGYALGERARQALLPTRTPLLSVEATLMAADVHVVRAAFSDRKIEAASLHEPGTLPLILLNTRAPRVAQRLSRRAILAHELCHLLHDASREDEIVSRVSWAHHGDHGDDVERRARAFAPAFIAPTAWVRQELEAREVGLDSPAKIATHIAARWGFTFEGAVWHAKNAQLIDAKMARWMTGQRRPPALPPAVSGFEPPLDPVRPQDHHPDLPAEPSWLLNGLGARIVLEALDHDLITVGRAHEILTWR